MKKDDKKDKINFSAKEKNPSKYINITPKLDISSINEASDKTAVITFGRFNPITVGHERLVNKVVDVAKKARAVPEIHMSHTTDAKKNPLSYNDKVRFMRAAFGSIVKETPARTIIDVAKTLSGKYGSLILVVGSDRVADFDTLLQKYNGKEYNFNKIEVVSAGERDPDADDVSGMSGSKMRKLAMDGDKTAFKYGLPKRLQPSADEIYNAVRRGMKLMEEEFLEEGEEVTEAQPLSFSQRRQRAMTMRKYANRLKLARARAEKRMATPEKLKTRAQKRALEVIRQKLSKTKAYADMTAAEKIAIDKRLAKIPKSVITRIATKLLPKVRQAEVQRLSDLHKPAGEKNESYDINGLFEQFVNEPTQSRKRKFRYLYTREGKVNYDGRFKMFRPKSHMSESAEDITADIYDLMESTESLFEGREMERVRNMIAAEKESDKRRHTQMLDRARKTDKVRAVRAEGVDKNNPLNRQYGTDSLVKILKSDTPGEKKISEAKQRMVPPLKHSPTTVPDFVEPATPDIAVNVSKHNKHLLGVGLDLKHMLKHAGTSKDVDNDGDVDAQDMKAQGELVGDPAFDLVKRGTQKMQQKYKGEKQHTKAGLAFEGYYTGMSKSTAAKRRAHFKRGAEMDDNNPAAYKPAPGDARAKTKPSVYTKRFKAMYGEETELEESAESSLRDKAEKTGISYGILKKVFDRGVAAWRTGHRPGTTPVQWGHARVNSFATGGKTRQTADADLWKQHSSNKNEEAISETKTAGFNGKMIDVPNEPVRMANGKIKMLPPGKSSSSKGGDGD